MKAVLAYSKAGHCFDFGPYCCLLDLRPAGFIFQVNLTYLLVYSILLFNDQLDFDDSLIHCVSSF